MRYVRGREPSYVFPLTDMDAPLSSGEGITRTSAKVTRLYSMAVWFQADKPMRTSIRAISKKQAESFARARHPTLTRLEFL